MKKLNLIFILLLLGSQLIAQDSLINPESKKVLFLGNSITYAGAYVVDIETYLTLKNPENKYTFYNLGLPSETVSGLSEEGHADGKFPRPDLFERLDRILDQIQPELIFACYGMNDGIYLPFDEDRFELFKKGVLRLDAKAKATGSDIIWLTPPIYDERKGEAYANVLEIYSDWILSKKHTDNWKVIDIHWPMKESLEDHRSIDPDFAFAKDGIHPNTLGHWEMAKPVLDYLGYPEVNSMKTPQEAFNSSKHGSAILEIIEKKQAILKHAWLTKTGHQRPGLPQGLPITKAEDQVEKLENQLYNLLLEK